MATPPPPRLRTFRMNEAAQALTLPSWTMTIKRVKKIQIVVMAKAGEHAPFSNVTDSTSSPGCTPESWEVVVQSLDYGGQRHHEYLLEVLDDEGNTSFVQLDVDFDPEVSETEVECTRRVHDAHATVRKKDLAMGDMTGAGDHLRRVGFVAPFVAQR